MFSSRVFPFWLAVPFCAFLNLVPTTYAAVDPAEIGQWGPPLNWPIVAIHMSLLPTGEVLVFNDHGDGVGTEANLWDPVLDTLTEVRGWPSVLFRACCPSGWPGPGVRWDSRGGVSRDS